MLITLKVIILYITQVIISIQTSVKLGTENTVERDREKGEMKTEKKYKSHSTLDIVSFT